MAKNVRRQAEPTTREIARALGTSERLVLKWTANLGIQPMRTVGRAKLWEPGTAARLKRAGIGLDIRGRKPRTPEGREARKRKVAERMADTQSAG